MTTRELRPGDVLLNRYDGDAWLVLAVRPNRDPTSLNCVSQVDMVRLSRYDRHTWSFVDVTARDSTDFVFIPG